MKQMIQVKPTSLLQMEPLALADFLRNEVDICVPDNIDDQRNAAQAVAAMHKAAAYMSYFKEMETLARLEKRNSKRKGCTPEEADRLLGCEEVFETYKRIAENYFETVTKMMTMKRLQLEEMKNLVRTT